MFSIQFIDEPPFQDEGLSYRFGLIQIGDFKEGFCAGLSSWNERAYEAHWRHELTALVAGKPKVSLLVACGDSQDCHLQSWALYREGKNVYLQNHYFFCGTLPAGFVPEDVSRFTRTRETIDEDGNRISEWAVPLREIELFLNRVQTS